MTKSNKIILGILAGYLVIMLIIFLPGYLKNKESSKENDNRIKIHLLSENNEEGTNRN